MTIVLRREQAPARESGACPWTIGAARPRSRTHRASSGTNSDFLKDRVHLPADRRKKRINASKQGRNNLELRMLTRWHSIWSLRKNKNFSFCILRNVPPTEWVASGSSTWPSMNSCNPSGKESRPAFSRVIPSIFPITREAPPSMTYPSLQQKWMVTIGCLFTSFRCRRRASSARYSAQSSQSSLFENKMAFGFLSFFDAEHMIPLVGFLSLT